MIISANEIEKYMQIHNVDKIPVEVVNTDLPESKELRQGVRKLAKRLVITGAKTGRFGGNRYNKTPGIDAVHVNYMIYNSFKKSQCYLPPHWELDVLTGEIGQKVLTELADHSGNLEQKFRDTYAKYNPEIQEKVAEAAKLLKEAEKISEEHGIPFYPNVNLIDGMAQGYYPQSCDAIFGDLNEEDSDIITELTGVYRYNDSDGWQSSAGSC